MASTIKELFDDFKFLTTTYTEKLPITEELFFRLLTRGIQEFQRETLYIERVADITLTTVNGADVFLVPTDFWQPIELQDAAGYTLVSQEYTQYKRNQEHSTRGFLETPTDYSWRLGDRTNWPDGRKNMARMFTVFNGQIQIFPAAADTTLRMFYIPEIHAYSSISPQYTAWNASPAAFLNLFNTARINDKLSNYENAFVNYAVSTYIRAGGHPDYLVYEKYFHADIEKAKISKVVFTSESVLDYYFAPYA